MTSRCLYCKIHATKRKQLLEKILPYFIPLHGEWSVDPPVPVPPSPRHCSASLAGFENVTNADISRVVIDQMMETYKAYEDMTCELYVVARAGAGGGEYM